jgi:hypothetical protein
MVNGNHEKTGVMKIQAAEEEEVEEWPHVCWQAWATVSISKGLYISNTDKGNMTKKPSWTESP